MKRVFVKTNARKFIAAAALMLLFSTAALATENPHVEYAGATTGSVSFLIKHNNPTGEKFYLTVMNEAGETIYTRLYEGNGIDQKLVIENLPEDGARITFVIKGPKGSSSETFTVSPVTRATTELVVSKTK